MFIPGRIDVITLGCSKNLVESEKLLCRLSAKGYTVFHDSPVLQGEFVVVNTCGFISDAKEESINLILELTELKKEKKIGHIIVAGCLSERYKKDLPEEIPEVDQWYGKFNWNEFIDKLPNLKKSYSKPKLWERQLTTPSHSAYLKISEGCNRFCAFCAIPLITGRHHSRPIDEILDETRNLVKKGVKEFNIIAQDLSSYGIDLYGRSALAELIERLAQTEGVEWIRLHYAYPVDFPEDLLNVMAKYPNVCKYLDIAFQHISDKVLTNMQRHISKEETLLLINKIREKVPGIKLRTTLMVGFPGEGEEEFNELLEFVRDQKFERMGAFTYSEEEDTNAARLFRDDITSDTKSRRLDQLMELQEEISLQHNQKLVGTVQKVLIDRIEKDTAYGRTQYDSPEVDPEVLIYNTDLNPGDFVMVKITEAYPFELIGQVEE